MKSYIYDGSFDGLLTAIYEAYYRGEKPNSILAKQDVQENLFVENIFIPTDVEKAQKVYNSIGTKISNTALSNVFYCFLSDLEDAGTLIFEYLQFGWKIGKDIDKYIADDRVLKIHKLKQKVTFEGHRMLGLVRFSQLSGDIYYAAIEPQYQIVGILASHFSKRLSDQHWIIHDVQRGMGAFYDKKDWVMKEIDMNPIQTINEEEIEVQRLWREYYKSIAIKNRINPRLQRRNMPARYWKYLVEKQ